MTWLFLLLAWLLDTSTRTDRGKDTDPPPDSEGDGEQEEDDEESEGDEPKDRHGKPIRDPAAKLKAQEEQIDRLAKKLKKKDDRIKELEESSNGGDDVRSLRLENAFLRSVLTHEDSISDWEAAWDLAAARNLLDTVKIADDGVVEGMDEALSLIVDRYPWLVDSDNDDHDDEPKAKTRQPRPKQTTRKVADRAALQKRFPALRSRRRR